MKIAINGTSLLHKNKTGVELYVEVLLKEMSKLKESNNFEFFVYYPKLKDQKIDGDYIKQFPDNWHFKEIKWVFKYFWTQLAFLKEVRKEKIDCLFIPAHVIPFFYNSCAVMTIHDLAFKYFDEAYSFKELRYQDFAIKSAIKKNAFFIVPSQTTADDMYKFYKVDKNKVKVVYHGFSAHKKMQEASTEDILTVKNKFNIKEQKYFINIGRIENKKNSYRIAQAFDRLVEENNYDDIAMVFSGIAGLGYKEILQKIKRLKNKEKIYFLPYLNAEEYNSLMYGAYSFVFPSLYEGFGFPILEAMSYSLPVITSNYGAMKEILGGAGLLVDPKNVDDIKNNMNLLLKDENVYQKYIDLGNRRYKDFSWEQTARESLAVFKEIQKKYV